LKNKIRICVFVTLIFIRESGSQSSHFWSWNYGGKLSSS